MYTCLIKYSISYGELKSTYMPIYNEHVENSDTTLSPTFSKHALLKIAKNILQKYFKIAVDSFLLVSD